MQQQQQHSYQNRTIQPQQRFRARNVCPVCGGFDSGILRQRGGRCYGWLSDDKGLAFCTRKEYAGSLLQRGNSAAYLHKLEGDCECGRNHGALPTPAPVMNKNGSRRNYRPEEHQGIIECYYTYLDCDNNKPLYRVVRYMSPKGFSQQRYEQGEWRWGLKDCKRVLYQLPQLLACGLEETVYLTEGEKDVLALWKAGFRATTNAGSVTNWRSEFNKYLRGRRVVILEDHDKAGMDRTDRLVEELAPVVAELKVGWFPNTPSGYDVSDWLGSGRTVPEIPTFTTSVARLMTGANGG